MHAAWPSQADYIMALQDPASAFVDPALRAATVETDSVLDLPKPRSGQMASVYKVFDGRKTWAIRCFNFASEERAARYRGISSFLAGNPNRYTVDFAYARAGIVVSAEAYPTVKMEWVEGDLLHTYIARHLEAPDTLQRLARAWVEMIETLHALGMAHCDLQHGNVLVTRGGELKLIDYDGMFVPEFAGLPSLEDGHPNYQHPCRQARDFGSSLDNFSAWVVYLSLVALVRDRNAWEALRFGDDCLALRRADYVRPSESAAFSLLASAADPDVRRIAAFLRSLLSREPGHLPELERYARFGASSAAERGPESRAWRLAPFNGEPLPAGPYSEPFEPRAAPAHEDEPAPPPLIPKTLQPALARTGGGVAATLAGYWAFHAFGFATDQYIAIVALGWLLAGIIAFASRGSKRPG
jgi:hypothetical protein